ncbi:class I poly(R)-hydroxyalkanoic acid synthase [Acuticoccus sp. MNP-M23]|uniref:PHA/PHB synthase family protein n=1 Tax=Acuticoccus sp. MNP-M23 TaxID=3072793 RepID=UPI002815D692|nr:class I poly(R)-hydroxyalkanoic acid synthase [Acuticoccus sp. MNP-M23]WMS42876.1 class I poly(R)-hydroxyalkanoic acid synthase [Acuticoccus sp. MNP-M23]
MSQSQKKEQPLKTGDGRTRNDSERDQPGTPRDPILNYIVENPEAFAENIAKMLSHANSALTAYVKPMQDGEVKSDYTDELTEWTRTLSRVGHYWLADPRRAFEAQTRLATEWMSLYAHSLQRMSGEPTAPVAEPDPADKRFKDPDWSGVQFFDFLKQGYLITTRWAEKLVSETDDLDPHTRQKAEFYVRQLSAALSPSNFILTNPELLRETATQSGENLAKGMQMLAEDVARGHGELRLRQSDPDKFAVGVNMALTPGKVIAQNDVCQVIQYDAATEDVAKEPILIVPPWINKFYILDLNEEKSLIKWLVGQGHTVFVCSWVNPNEHHADKDFTHYMREGILFALETALLAADAEKMDVVGYCVGGTLLAMSLAYMARNGDKRANSATFLTAQVDFTHAGDLKVFVDKDQLETLEKKMRAKGYLDGAAMASAFNMLRANDLIWPYVINNYIRGKEPFPFDLLYWNSDSTRMPAANHAFYLRNFYLENLFAKGELTVDGLTLSPGDITVPIFNVATKEDHIAPAQSVFRGNAMFGGTADFVLTGSGHIAGIVNPPARNKYQVWTGGESGQGLEHWVATAKETPGSWWPLWDEWLTAHRSGERVPARTPGGGHFTPLEDAPGSYVKKRY